MKRGTLLVISGSSGVGKSTVIREVMSQRPDLYFSVSFTTREPREGEVNGVNYNTSLGAQGLEALQPNSSEMLEMMTRGKGTQAAGLKAKMRNEAYLYLPLPNSDVILSPEMKQNPAYSSNNQFEKQ